MRVISVIASADVGGAEVHLEHIARQVEAQHAIVALARGPMLERWAKAGADVEVIPVRGKSPIGAVRAFERLVSAFGATVVHAHTPKANLLMAMCRLRSPRVMTIHGSHRQFAASRSLPAFCFRWADLWSSRRSSIIVAVCESDRRELQQSGFDADKLIVIPNGVPDPGIFDEVITGIDIPDEILWIGRLSPEKRPKLMLEIARKIVEHSRVRRIRIVGKGELAREIRKSAHEKIVFEDNCDDLRMLWPSAAVIVNTSLSEGASLVILEAMASGVPVVASAVGGSREILDGAGFVVNNQRNDAATVEVFGSIINGLLDDENHRKAAARAARRRYLEKYRVETMAERLSELYRRVAMSEV